MSRIPRKSPSEEITLSLTRGEADRLHGLLVQSLLGSEITGLYSIHFYSGPGIDGVQIGHESDDRESPAREFGQQVMSLIEKLVSGRGTS